MSKFKSDFDFERASMLLNIMQQVANIGPMWSEMAGEAGDELKSMVEELRDTRKIRAERERDRNVVPGQPEDSGNRQPNDQDNLRTERPQRIFPEGSGVSEEHDAPVVQRRVNP